MGFINSIKKTFGVGNYGKEYWHIAIEIYGKSVADELRSLGGAPTSLMTRLEVEAYNVLMAIRNIENLELRSLPRMTDKRKAQLEERREIEEKARSVLGRDDYDKWNKRLEEYKHGVRDFTQLEPKSKGRVDTEEMITTSPLDNETEYETLARIFFDTCLEFTNNIGKIISRSNDIDRYSTETISTATIFGTAMYKYSARIACDRLSRVFPNQKEYEKNYTTLLHELAKKLQEPEDSFIDSIEHLDKQETLEILKNVSNETGQTLEAYLGIIKKSIDNILGEEVQGIRNLSYRQEVIQVLNELHNDFIRNPWENNPWVILTRNVCGDKIARELAQLDDMRGHGSILQICTKEESDAGRILIEAGLIRSSHSEGEIEKAHKLLYNHEESFWKKRLLLKKSGLSDTYYRASESDKENKTRWSEYEKIYGKTVASKLRKINKFCPGWLANKVSEKENLSWIDVQKKKPAFWQAAFNKYSTELSEITEKCREC